MSALRRLAQPPAALAAILAPLALLTAGAGSTRATVSPPPTASSVARTSRVHPFKLPRVRHVFVIMLENQGYKATFGNPSADPYLARTLPSQGALLENYYATGHQSNDNYISIVSGQPPNAQNQADCPRFDNFAGARRLANGVESGTGCVYPAEVPTIGNQLSTAKRSWKAYMQDMGNDPNREAAACGHPNLEATDETQKAQAGDAYATRHDPFVYFHSVIDKQSFCDKHVVALGSSSGEMPPSALRGESGLATDLRTAARTPKFSFITPNLCNDGHDFPCTNQPSGASALANIEAFLKTWVPKITSSPAYAQSGLLEIVFDEAAASEAESCCEEMPGPGSAMPGVLGPGGGRVGAVLLSPFIKAGTVSSAAYNHYSSLASWESLLKLPKLAYAATVPSTFGQDVFSASTGG